VSYSASQKASAAERWQQSAASEVHNNGGSAEVTFGSRPFHISSTTTIAGEQEFVRVDDGTPVYGTDTERARSDAEFFESVRRGDYRSLHCESGERQPSDDQRQTESPVETDFMSVDTRTSVESGGAPSDFPSSAAESNDTDLDESLAGVTISGQ